MSTIHNDSISQSTSAALLSRFVNNQDESAFAELVRRYDRIVWGVCIRVLGNRTDAEDAFQQTFVLLCQKADRIRKPNSLSSWLHGVAFRTATRIRKQRRQQAFENLTDVAQAPEPFDEIAQRHQSEQIDRQLHSLHEKFRAPLVLFYFQNRSVPQIATELGLTTAAVEGRLRRGRQQLKRGLLSHQCDLSILLPLLMTSPAGSVVASSTTNAITAGTGLFPIGFLNTCRMGFSAMMKKTLVAGAFVALTGFAAALHARPATSVSNDLDTEVVLSEAATSTVTVVDANDEAEEPSHAALIREWHDDLYAFLLSLHGV